MDPRRDTGLGVPLPVDPADVPDGAVRAVKRTLLRNSTGDPVDDDLARLVVAVVIASLGQQDGDSEQSGTI